MLPYFCSQTLFGTQMIWETLFPCQSPFPIIISISHKHRCHLDRIPNRAYPELDSGFGTGAVCGEIRPSPQTDFSIRLSSHPSVCHTHNLTRLNNADTSLRRIQFLPTVVLISTKPPPINNKNLDNLWKVLYFSGQGNNRTEIQMILFRNKNGYSGCS